MIEFILWIVVVISLLFLGRAHGQIKKLKQDNKNLTNLVLEESKDGKTAKKSLVVIPNTTPCGDLCKYAFYVKNKKKFHCNAGAGHSIDIAREKFEDYTGNCTMFERPNLFVRIIKYIE